MHAGTLWNDRNALHINQSGYYHNVQKYIRMYQNEYLNVCAWWYVNCMSTKDLKGKNS